MRLTWKVLQTIDNYPLSVATAEFAVGTDYDKLGRRDCFHRQMQGLCVEYQGGWMTWKDWPHPYNTLFRSEFTDKVHLPPLQLDTRHMLNLLAATTSPQLEYLHALAYVVHPTLIDMELFDQQDPGAWQTAPIRLWTYNTLRLKDSHQLDLRLDKEFIMKSWCWTSYFDVQNAYNFQSENAPFITNRNATECDGWSGQRRKAKTQTNWAYSAQCCAIVMVNLTIRLTSICFHDYCISLAVIFSFWYNNSLKWKDLYFCNVIRCFRICLKLSFIVLNDWLLMNSFYKKIFKYD